VRANYPRFSRRHAKRYADGWREIQVLWINQQLNHNRAFRRQNPNGDVCRRNHDPLFDFSHDCDLFCPVRDGA
jgi:hypothetical protein